MSDYASNAGTNLYQDKLIHSLNLPESHFRDFLNLKLSSLGMGTYLGGLDNKTDELVVKAVIKSVKNGINVIDTAINYRLQRAERSIGKALKILQQSGFERDQYFISTKVGYIPGDADLALDSRLYIQNILLKQQIISKNEIIGMNCMSPLFLRHQIKQSLNNLDISCIDLLYLHNIADAQKSVLGEELFYKKLYDAFILLEEYVKEKQVRYYGIATWDCLRVKLDSPNYLNIQRVVDLASKAAEKFNKKESGFKFFMLPFNFLMSEASILKNQDGKTVIEKAKELNLGLFGAVPLMQANNLNHPKLLDLMRDLKLKSQAHAALQFVRNIGMPLIAPLVGHKKTENIEENLNLIRLARI